MEHTNGIINNSTGVYRAKSARKYLWEWRKGETTYGSSCPCLRFSGFFFPRRLGRDGILWEGRGWGLAYQGGAENAGSRKRRVELMLFCKMGEIGAWNVSLVLVALAFVRTYVCQRFDEFEMFCAFTHAHMFGDLIARETSWSGWAGFSCGGLNYCTCTQCTATIPKACVVALRL